MKKSTAVGRFFEDLANGDPVALTVLGIFVAITIVTLLGLWLFVRRERRQEEEERNRRYGKGKGGRNR